MDKRVLGIFTEEDLRRMLRHPEHNYKLQKDIDLQGGWWDPPAVFESVLEGNGKTIRNARINTPAGGCLGFFGTVAESGAVKNLTLENLQIAGCDDAAFLGGVAGINRGCIENVTLTGSMFDSRTDGCAVGAIAGCNSGSITGVRSELHITVPEGKRLGLVGENAPEATAQGLWRDYRYADRPISPESMAMRQTAIAHSFRMGSHPWRVPAPLKFTSPYVASCSQQFVPGETYYGLPYTNKYGSYERFVYSLDETGTVKPEIMALGDGFDGFDRFMGADCSGNIYWSWGRVCCGISFKATVDMVPLPENRELYGVIPVGDYVATLEDDTLQDIQNIGEDKMLECLAQLQPGDAIVNRLVGQGGHTKLVTRHPEIYRDACGIIDREESVLYTNELGGTGSELNGGYSRWSLDRRNKFATLMRQGYIPITTPELAAGKRTPVELRTNVTGPAAGTVESNYRIISTTVTLEKDGVSVCKSLRFTAVAATAPGNDETVARSTVRKADLKCHAEDLKNLPAGSYTYRVQVLLSTGKTYTVREGQWTIDN